jgi:hypothetical protein
MAMFTKERNKAKSRGNGHVHNCMRIIVYGEKCFMDRFSKGGCELSNFLHGLYRVSIVYSGF